MMAWVRRGGELTWCVNRQIRLHRQLDCLSVQTRLYRNGPEKNVAPTRTSKHIRQSFIDFFKENKHLHIPSSSIIPRAGEGTYFTNAGMNQFKPVFLGVADPSSKMADYRRVVNSQRCVRVGGKHNDLDDVGEDTTHHTFFEMLGSWSFGDYFKKAACAYAWDLLTNIYQIPSQHLYVTYFGGDEILKLKADVESRDIWLDLGVPPERVIPSGATDNFWDMGDTGPCGPCTEIHYAYNGSGKLAHLVNTNNASVLEIWNLVFMQFDRQADGSLLPLPKQHVDTGMGLERITAVLQGVKSNYDTDLFTPIFKQIHYNCSCPPYEGKTLGQDKRGIDRAYRIVADHMRMVTVALADGLRPGNKDQGSKVRQILYRALKQSRDVLRAPPGFLSSLVPVIIDALGDGFPENTLDQYEMKHIIDHSEQKINLMERVLAKNMKRAIEFYGGNNSLTAEQLLEIHEGRFGNTVSIDMLEEMCRSNNIKMDLEGVQKIVEEQKVHTVNYEDVEGREQINLNQHHTAWLQEKGISRTDDSHKYNYTSDDGSYAFPPLESEVLAILHDADFVDKVREGDHCGVVVKDTCFYSEAGGQIADLGYIRKGAESNLRVVDVRSSSGYVLHTCSVLKGGLKVGDHIKLSLNQAHRYGCMQNHTGTHMVNFALEKVLGNVTQQGSMVSSEKFTFDFSCSKVAIDFNDIRSITEAVNTLLHENLPVYKEEVPLERAQGIPGLRCLQDEVYPSQVRVVSVGAPVDRLLMNQNNASSQFHCVELCGGTHVDNTGDLDALVITNFKGLTQGTRRITAVTGRTAIQALEESHDLKSRLHKLSNDIFHGNGREEWQDRAEYIEKRLSDGTVLPKIERDALQASLDQIKYRAFSHTKNTSIKEKLCEQIQLVLGLHTANLPLVTEFPFKKARDVVAVLATMEVKIPLMLLSTPSASKDAKKSSDLIFGVCFVPEGSSKGFTAKSWSKHVAHYSKGTFHDPKGKLAKKGELIQVLAFPAEKSALVQAMDLAITYANLYKEK